MYCLQKYFILLCGILGCQAAELKLLSGDKNITTDLSNPTVLLPYLNASRITLFYTHGVNGSSDSISVNTVIKAFATTVNVVLLDWRKGAYIPPKGVVPVSYVLYNVPNAEKIGFQMGEALVTLIKNGLKVSDFFLMGHSLGAHVMGNAGRYTKKFGYTVPRIIGLDPAGPEFTTVVPILPPLDSSCAEYVCIIHTDPNGLGSPKPTGHVDIFANYNKTYTMQPGCTEKSNPLVLNAFTTCSHDLSWRLIGASVEYSNMLIAQHAANGDAWLDGQGDDQDVVCLSVEPTEGASGSYFLKTVEEYPYGLGDEGMFA